MVGLWLDSRPWFRIFPTLPRIAKVSVHGLSGRESGRKLIGRERDGRELIPLHPFGKKKTGTYILSVYKRGEKTRARAEAEARRGRAVWRVIYEYCLRRKVYRYRAATSISLSTSRRLRNDFCAAIPFVYVRVVSGGRRIIVRNDRKFRRVVLTGPLVSMRVHANTW